MKKSLSFIAVAALICCFIFNCKSSDYTLIGTNSITPIEAEHLDCCDNFQQQAMILEPAKEVFLLVHGCKSSSGYFSTLKEVFESRGQQAICFSYNYRDSIEDCSGKLVAAINTIFDLVHPPELTVIGHSQGGLVARRALVLSRSDRRDLDDNDKKIRLVTISSPFNGIKASSHCGITALHVASAGITALICQAVAGSTWSEINPSSDFIRDPGELVDTVYTHIKINTDEEDTCRNFDDEGNCLKSDFIFDLEEQYSKVIERDTRVVNIEVKAGHAQIVGRPGEPPFILIDTLEAFEILDQPTSLSREEENILLSRLYK